MSLLPPNSTPFERAMEKVIAARFATIGVPLRDLWSAQDCPEPLLPWLARAVGVEQWDDTWPISVRRARVGSAIAIHRAKGTAQAVADVVQAYGGTVRLQEWFEQTPPAPPFTFSLTAAVGGQGNSSPSAEFIASMIADVSRAKPARAHFAFSVAVSSLGAIGLRAVARPATYARLSGAAV